MFFLINLTFGLDNARVIKQYDIISNEDFVVNFAGTEYLDNQQILDLKTKKNELGYILRDNIEFSIHITNRNIVSNTCIVEYYYLEEIDNKIIKIRTEDTFYHFDNIINSIPSHTFRYLKNINGFNNKVFVVKLYYDKVNNEITSSSTDSEVDFDINENDEKIEHLSKCFYFKVANDDEYLAYKKIRDDAANFSIKKKGPVDIED